MKLYFKILAIAAAVALLPLQYVLLLKVYNSLEKNLYITVDECFRNAVEQESLSRFVKLDTTGALVGIRDYLEISGSEINLDSISAAFAENLAEKELQNLSFHVYETQNDTNLFRTAEDFLSDPVMEKTSFSTFFRSLPTCAFTFADK